MGLKRVGIFREVRASENRLGLPSIRAAARPSAQPDEDRLVNYLKAGVCLLAAGDYSADVLNPSAGFGPGASNYLTDGVWMWLGPLAYYMANYHIELPSAFVADARQNGWVVPALSRATRDALTMEIVRGWRTAEQEQAEPDAAPDPAT